MNLRKTNLCEIIELKINRKTLSLDSADKAKFHSNQDPNHYFGERISDIPSDAFKIINLKGIFINSLSY